MNSLSDSLTGKTIAGLDVSDDEHALRFRTNETSIVWDTYGDCCSESWWADGFELSALRGGRVVSVEEIPLPDYNVDDGRGRQEEDVVYGVRVTTDKGVATLAFRNSSNGYYGGSACLGADEGYEWREIAGKRLAGVSRPKLCACGCGQSLEGMRETAKYANGSCARDHRRKLAKAPEGRTEGMRWVGGYWRRTPRHNAANRP